MVATRGTAAKNLSKYSKSISDLDHNTKIKAFKMPDETTVACNAIHSKSFNRRFFNYGLLVVYKKVKG